MRRLLLPLALVLLLATPFALRRLVGRSTPSDAAKQVGPEQRLVVVCPHNQDIRKEFGDAFGRWHREKYGAPVVMDFRTLGGTNDIKRQLETQYQLYRRADGTLPPADQVPGDLHVVWGGGDYFFNNELKPLGILQPIALEGEIKRLFDETFPQPRLAGVKLYDDAKDANGVAQPQWIGICLSSFGIVYNPDLFDRLGLPYPQSWPDLTSEKLSGLLALADPTRSGSASVAYTMVLQRRMADAEEAYRLTQKGSDGNPPAMKDLDRKSPTYQAAIDAGWHQGMADLLLMAANARYFTDNATLVPSDVGDGQAAAGIAIDFYGRVYQESVGARRCTFVSPAAATAITPDPVAILYGVKGQKLELARHFVEFLLTPEAQLLWIHQAKRSPDGSPLPGYPADRAMRRPPIRSSLYKDQTDWTDRVNPFAEAGGFNQRGEWMGTMTDTRMIWAAAWIDAREELQSAYSKIRDLPDPQNRATRLKKLADLPIQLGDVRRLIVERKALEASRGDSDQWKARQRMEWAAKFRTHYRAAAG